jgi:hypothetical protein
MRRKPLLVALGLFVFLAGTACGTMVILVRHEPAFYHEAAIPPGAYREKQSKEFWSKLNNLTNSIINNDPKWSEEFTADQINSYLGEDFLHPRNGANETMLPEGFHAPRVAIEDGKIRLAFRYGTGTWSTIVSVDLHVWLVAKQLNCVAIELQGFHAGSLPITPQSLLEYISEAVRPMSIEINWYRHHGNPVALLRLQADQTQPTIQLSRLQVSQGKLLIAGKSLLDGPRESMPVTALKPPID